ncbi:hypothetical protein BDW22DRAFT_242516 [Trametopsis cervina]|nr:hypothetical protein BDW22DRAFT_242516 [Trametopsis cervina]
MIDDRIENYKHQHPGYRSLSTPIDDVTKYLAEACLLNGILRSPGMRHPNGFTIIVPDAAKLKPLAKTFVTNQKKGGKTQEDHFIEIQHAVDMAINVVGNTVFTYSRPIGYFMDLALYLNDPRNTYALVTDNNQYKKQIPLRAYAGNDFMDAYLASKLQIQVLKRLNNGQIKKRTVKTTVQAQIKSLVVDMMRQGEYSELTNALGRELAIVFGFNDIL